MSLPVGASTLQRTGMVGAQQQQQQIMSAGAKSQSQQRTTCITYYWYGPDHSFGIQFKFFSNVKYALLKVVGVGVHGPSYPEAVLKINRYIGC
jgi:hypothetical protein